MNRAIDETKTKGPGSEIRGRASCVDQNGRKAILGKRVPIMREVITGQPAVDVRIQVRDLVVAGSIRAIAESLCHFNPTAKGER